MADRMNDLTKKVHQTIHSLQQEFPEEGFVLIGLTDLGKETGVCLASNLDEEAFESVLENVLEGGDAVERIVSTKQLYN